MKTCWTFARDEWQRVTGVDLEKDLPDDHGSSFLELVRFYRAQRETVAAKMTSLEQPQDPCFVVMEQRFGLPHFGVFHSGLLHHQDLIGISKAEPLAIALREKSYNRILYYR